MDQIPHTEQFVADLTAYQSRLYAYICAIMGGADQAHDVLQETNMVLWRKAGEFEPGTDFGAWAAKIAYFQVLAHRKRRSGDRHVFSDDLLVDIADEFDRQNPTIDERQTALRQCMDKLPAMERDMVRQRYEAGGSVKRIAAQIGRSVGAVSQSLYRIRAALAECVERTITGGES
ncbi:MAG: sigma-70 family RNA polymerase sigma factor [Planctomycetes bacterium]|nr:sigma-70 family RNA polymerase sigma factor [Planctomycetota bacterium]